MSGRKMVTCSAHKSRRLGALSDRAERLYWRIYLASDKYGVIEGDPFDVRMLAAPNIGAWTDAIVAEALAELVSSKLVVVWTDNDGTWVHVDGHDKHQSADYLRKRGASARNIPAPAENLPYDALTCPNVPYDALLAPTTTTTTPTGVKVSDETMSDDERAVFDYWLLVAAPVQVAEPKRARLTKGRATKIRARLKDGYSVADLCRCIDGFAADDFHRGKNDRKTPYLDLPTIFRNAEKVDAGLRMAADRGGATVDGGRWWEEMSDIRSGGA